MPQNRDVYVIKWEWEQTDAVVFAHFANSLKFFGNCSSNTLLTATTITATNAHLTPQQHSVRTLLVCCCNCYSLWMVVAVVAQHGLLVVFVAQGWSLQNYQIFHTLCIAATVSNLKFYHKVVVAALIAVKWLKAVFVLVAWSFTEISPV